jgi:hypothetical protein
VENNSQALPSFIGQSMNVLTSTSTDTDFTVTKSLLLHSLLLIVTCLSYNAALTLSLLSSSPTWTNQFFHIWFKNLNLLTRVHDKKLCIAAISELLEELARQAASGGGSELMQSVNKFVGGALVVFRDLPESIERKIHIPLLTMSFLH